MWDISRCAFSAFRFKPIICVLMDHRRFDSIVRFRCVAMSASARADGPGFRRFGLILAIAACIFVPESALADSVIDAGVKPYFVLGGWLTALVFLGLGYFLLSKAIRARRLAAAVEQWPTANGTVIAADIVKRVSKSEDEFDSFIPEVRYAYKANGSRREGRVIRIGLDEMGYIQEKQACDHIARYPVGAKILVRYDPQDPEQAVLETGQVGAGRKMFAGSLLAGIGVAAIVFAIWIATLPVQ